MAEPIDFEAEGLLEGIEGSERESRLELLQRLSADGFGLQELREAAAEGRLAVLPVERLLAGVPKYSPEEVAELAGVPIEHLERQWRSIGVAVPERDEKSMASEDLEAAHRQRSLLDSGLEPDAIAELGRTIAVAMSQFAAASRQIMASSFAPPGDSESEISERIYEQAQALTPQVGPTLDYVYRLHLREQLRHAAFGVEDVDRRAGSSAEVIAVGFADLVGFTKLGEELPPEELGAVTGCLDELSREVAHGPVRLVKLIGDAAMFTSPDTEALLEATFELIEGVAEQGEGFPLLRAGVARGPALSRGGDFYGSPVNLASRITGVARPGSVLVSNEVRKQVGDLYRFSEAGQKHLKGIAAVVPLYRCRELEVGEREQDRDQSADEVRDDGDAPQGRGRKRPRGRGRRRR